MGYDVQSCLVSFKTSMGMQTSTLYPRFILLPKIGIMFGINKSSFTLTKYTLVLATVSPSFLHDDGFLLYFKLKGAVQLEVEGPARSSSNLVLAQLVI